MDEKNPEWRQRWLNQMAEDLRQAAAADAARGHPPDPPPVRSVDEWLADDPEVQANLSGLRDQYTFTAEDLITFVQAMLFSGYLYGALEEIEPVPHLDNDMQGAVGIAWAIKEIADLEVDETGLVLLPEATDPEDDEAAQRD